MKQRPLAAWTIALAGLLVARDCAADQWGPSDAPTIFSSTFEYSLEVLPKTGTASATAWPSSYWPVYLDSINYKWDGPASQTPAEKYEQAFGVSGLADAVSLHHGIDAFPNNLPCTSDDQCNVAAGEVCAKREGQSVGRCIPTSTGNTRGASAAMLLFSEPQQTATHNGVTFKVNDIKALLALVLTDLASTIAGGDCTGDIEYDLSGRPIADDCKDTNPGTYHVLLTNYLGTLSTGFAEDRTFDDEVWNQPLRGYRVSVHSPIPAARARQRVAAIPRDRRGFDLAADEFDVLGELPVAAGESLEVRMTGSGDADLYVRKGAAPSLTEFDCRPLDPTSNKESCQIVVSPGETSIFVGVHANGAATRGRIKVKLSRDAPYVYNPAAASLVRVRMKADSVEQGEIQSDGSIPLVPIENDLSYLLELDSAGKIVGGEWLGESKSKHPDFLWNPQSPVGSPPSAAGGLITFENVELLYNLSQ